MNRRDFFIGLILTSIGMFLILFFDTIEDLRTSTAFKWLGVALMIGGPLAFWEIISLRNGDE